MMGEKVPYFARRKIIQNTIQMDFRIEKNKSAPQSSTFEVILSHSGQSTQRGTEQLPKHHTQW